MFELIGGDCGIDAAPCRAVSGQGELFDDAEPASLRAAENWPLFERDRTILAGMFSSGGPELASLPESGRRLFALSINALDAVVHAWLSELPVAAGIIRFGRKVLAAAEAAGKKASAGRRDQAERYAAECAAANRGDPDTLTVLNAAYKVRFEIHRLTGFLRFSPGGDGRYLARCGPDHFVLPALGEHFTRRFGDLPWVIIDEKRRCCLRRLDGGPPLLCGLDALADCGGPRSAADEWENLWRLYHHTINIESRTNPGLQRRFMPQRYWKYLPEM